MRQAVSQILHSLDTGRAVAYCRLVETRGSTPQKAGAVMLVFADGSQQGTLGGGCVEAEVKRRAMAALEAKEPVVAEFQLDHDYGWDDGLICGGRMTVVVFPMVDDSFRVYFDEFGRQLEAGHGVHELLVYQSQTHDAAERTTVPSSFLLNEQKELLASFPEANDGARAESLCAQLPSLSDRPRPTCHGGVAQLPILPRCRLIIVGAGHIGQEVARLAGRLDFEVWIVDDRADCASVDRFPDAARLIVGPLPETLSNLDEADVNASTYCLIVTRGHNHDQEALFHLAERPARYVGLIGSRRKIKLIFDNLVAEGVSPKALKRVFAPIGVNIGSQTVAEIAVSVAAELVAHRNLGDVPGRPDAVRVDE